MAAAADDESAWKLVESEDAEIVEVEDATDSAELDDALGKVAASVTSPLRLVADGCALGPAFAVSEQIGTRVASLSLGSAGLESFAAERPTALLDLNLSANSLAVVPPALGASCPRLRRLDLSFCAGIDVHRPGAWDGLGQLVVLSLEGCALATIAPDEAHLAPLTALRDLSVADNDLDDVETLAPIRQLPALRSLDASENPMVDDPGTFRKAALAYGPQLKRINNDNVGRPGASAQAWDQLETAAERQARAQRLQEDISADGRSREGCSCMWGNACVEEYTCLVWSKRELVAAAVRDGKLDSRKLLNAAATPAALKQELRAAGIAASSGD